MKEGYKPHKPAGSSPAANPLQITARQQSALIWTISLVGDLTLYANEEIAKVLEQIPPPCTVLILDFSRCEYINTAGVAAIISLITHSQQAQRRLLGYGLREHYHKLFHMVGLQNYIEMCAGESEATTKAEAGGQASDGARPATHET